MSDGEMMEILEEAMFEPLECGLAVNVIFFRKAGGGLGMTMATMPPGGGKHVPFAQVPQDAPMLRQCLGAARKALDKVYKTD